ncbi:MAG: hypothetical protein RR847_02590 [Bacilli bacterium]
MNLFKKSRLKNHGFTMIELIGIITIMGILLIMTVPSLIGTLETNEIKRYENFKRSIELASETYVQENMDKFPVLENAEGKVFISIKTLIDNNLIKKVVEDPKTEKKVPLDYTVMVSKQIDGTLNYEFNNINASPTGYVQDNLVLHYDGYIKPVIENNSQIWKDLSKSQANGVMIGFDSANNWQNNKILFNNNNNVIEAQNSANLFNSDLSFTMSIVVESLNMYASAMPIIAKNDTTSSIYTTKGIGITNIYNPQSTYVSIKSTEKEYKLIAFDTPSVNFPKVTLTVVKDSNNIKLYKNKTNIKVFSIEAGYGSINSNTNIKIGYNNTINVYSVVIYDKALTPTEITKNYNIDKIRFGVE